MKHFVPFVAALLTLTGNLAAPLAALADPGVPADWTPVSSKPGAYDFGTEQIAGSEGPQSAYIRANRDATVGDPTGHPTGALFQTVEADAYVGQRVRVSARLKSDAVDRLQLWFRARGADPKAKDLVRYDMGDRPIRGTTGWKRYDIVLDIPSGSTTIGFGFLLLGGKGEGWADAFRVEKVDKSVPVSRRSVASTPTNLSFDQ